MLRTTYVKKSVTCFVLIEKIENSTNYFQL